MNECFEHAAAAEGPYALPIRTPIWKMKIQLLNKNMFPYPIVKGVKFF